MRPERFEGLEPGLAGLLLPIAEAEFPEQVMALAWWSGERRAVGLSLLALIAELKAIPAKVTEPTLGAVRFAFWREVAAEAAAGTARAHPVAQGLAAIWPQMAPLALEDITALIDAGEEALPEAEGITPLGPVELYGTALSTLSLAAGGGHGSAMRDLGEALGRLVLYRDKDNAKVRWAEAWQAASPFGPEAAPVAGAAKLEARRLLNGSSSPLSQRLSLMMTILRGR
ncbi:MAG: hypothetical protein AAGA69_08770 [Pseudomonadota bacterium]